jgi:hypothetical protein
MAQTLPPVASSFYTHCKKCEVERYHKVLVHATESTVKLQCEVCAKKSTLKFEDPNAKKSKGPKKTSAAKVSAARNMYVEEFEMMKSQNDSNKAKPYSMRTIFQTSETIQHPKFGMGFIKSVQGDKIEVFFEDEARFLVHNRQ